MESFISTFHIDWKIIIAQSINFVVVLFILNFLIVKPLKKLMRERSLTIEGGLDDAAKNKELLKNTKKEYEDVLAKARTEAHEIFLEGKKDAEDKKKIMIEDAKKEVENMILSGKKTLESEKIKIIEEAKGEIVSLVVKATEKLLESHKDESFDKKVLEQIKRI
jgi:F-type H+-transporting ATPase subunit b